MYYFVRKVASEAGCVGSATCILRDITQVHMNSFCFEAVFYVLSFKLGAENAFL